eukprot:TRINITY_DN108112_c0_g1_i1.p1 TRINITY_DN108112_c0_g1~~TRINITY_DN108112_c0_g1_i1.p1  ORF type:complete len:164 (+),score=27.62 TRINITY_DN108112_c0_g1_i1:95-586(+)
MAVTMTATVPEGVAAGGYFSVATPDGQVLQLQAAEGAGGYGGAGSAVAFQYLPVTMHEGDLDNFAEGMRLATERQEALMAAGIPCAAAPVDFTGEFEGFQYPPASYYVGQTALVTRSDDSVSTCTISDIFLTAMGPVYTVCLGVNESGEPIEKSVQDSDLQAA